LAVLTLLGGGFLKLSLGNFEFDLFDAPSLLCLRVQDRHQEMLRPVSLLTRRETKERIEVRLDGRLALALGLETRLKSDRRVT
jgi:hypothetical protein